MPVLPSYRNQPIDLLCNQLTGFYMRETLAFNGLTHQSLVFLSYTGCINKSEPAKKTRFIEIDKYCLNDFLVVTKFN